MSEVSGADRVSGLAETLALYIVNSQLTCSTTDILDVKMDASSTFFAKPIIAICIMRKFFTKPNFTLSIASKSSSNLLFDE